MGLDDGQFADLIDTQLLSAGAKDYPGSNRKKFCKAMATGINKSVRGKSFVSADQGTIPGIGKGTGTGIVGLMPDSMAKIGLAMGPTMLGANALKLMTAIMNATQQHFAMAAALTSTDAPVFAGQGTMVIGTLQVDMDEMAMNIKSAFDDAEATGNNVHPLAKAVSAGVTFGLLTMATGSLAILGVPTGIPAGGAGVGQGVVK